MHAFARTVVLVAFTTCLTAQDPAFLRDDVFSALSWRSIGPVNFGGRIVDVAANPKNPSEFYVAAATGGVFKTSNNGVTFAPVFDKQSTLNIGALAVSPIDPEVVWVGTGEANNLRSGYFGNGVYRSGDAGKTWSHVGLDGTDHIARVVAHPTDAQVAFVAAMGPLYTSGPQRGIFKTADGGQTWKKTLFVDNDTGFSDVAIDPENPSVLFAAGYQCRRRAWNFAEGGPGGGIWRSEDGGESWDKLGGGLPGGDLGRIGLAVFPADPKIVYAYIENRNAADPRSERAERAPATQNGEGGDEGKEGEGKESAGAEPDVAAPGAVAIAAPPSRIRGGEVYRSDDSGKSWKLMKDRLMSDRPSHFFYFFGQIRVHPRDANRLWILDIAVHTSADGGKTWRQGPGRRLHSDNHALWIDPSNPRRMLLGNDGGLAQSFDNGETWDHFDTLPLAQYYAVGVDMRDPYRIYGGLQDNGTWGMPSRAETTNGLQRADAYRIGGGDGFYACVDPTDPDTIYSESQFGAVYRYDHRTGNSKSIRPRAPRGTPALRSNWNSPIALSPHDPHTVLFGTQFVHRSRDRGDTWEIISPDLSYADQERIAGNVPFATITTLAESPRRAGVIWAGTDDGRVWVTRTAGERWVEVTDRFPGMPQRLWVSRVEPSGHDADTAFVSFTGFREDIRKPFLYMTTDGGETFVSIANNLPDESINVVRQHPRNDQVLFVGTDLGVQVSVDNGASWHSLRSDMPANPVHDMVVHPRESDLVVGTHGRGLFVMDITPFEEMSASVLAKPFHAFPPRDGIVLGRGESRGNTGNRGWSAENGETRPVFWVYLREDVGDPATVRVLDAAGKEVFSRSNIKDAGLHRIPWRAARPTAGRRGGGGARGGRAGGAPDTVSAGQFAVEMTFGDTTRVLPFTVRVGANWAPGTQFGDEEDAGQRRGTGEGR